MVQISRPFYPSETEVTRGQYRDVVGQNPSDFNGSVDLPVGMVRWLDAVGFCQALSGKEKRTPFYRIEGDHVTVPDWWGRGYRLPTEAEWEYACRAGGPGRIGRTTSLPARATGTRAITACSATSPRTGGAVRW